MIKLYALLFLLALAWPIQAQIIGFQGFETRGDEHTYTQSDWIADGFTVPWVNGFDQNRCLVDDAYAFSGSNSLRVFYPAGEYGPGGTGGQAPLMVPGRQEYFISYSFRMSDNFSWGTTNEGGKLPGLSGGARCSGCNAVCDGTEGFSCRLMWRPGGRLVLYLYHMDKGGTCGDNLTLQDAGNNDVYVNPGEWYTVTQRVRVNTGSNHDGEVELWLNGVPALLVENLQFVNNGDLVDALYFSTFHGGGSAGWAPQNDCYIWFDDIIIGQTLDDVLGQPCQEPELGETISTCGQTFPISIPSNTTTNTNVTYRWYRNGGLIASQTSPTLALTNPATAAATYRVERDSAGVCIQTDSVTVVDVIPPVDLGTNQHLCDPPSTSLDAGVVGGGLGYRWDYADNFSYGSLAELNGQTGQVLSDVRSAGLYRSRVLASGCSTSWDTITVSSDLPTPGDNCATGLPISLNVSGPDNYAWFAGPSGGSALHTGPTYSAPSAGTYYAQSTSNFTTYVGPTSLLNDGYQTDGGDVTKQTLFTTNAPLTIDSVSLYWINYNTSPTQVAFYVYDMSDNLIAGDTATLTFSGVSNPNYWENRVDVDIQLPTPGNYKLMADHLNTSGGMFYTRHPYNTPYPYVGAPYNVIQITGNTTESGGFSHVYNWRIISGSACDRLPVYAQLGGCALPVVWLNYEAKREPGGARISWQTAQEENSAHFLIERSVDANAFEAIGQVIAAGQSDSPLAYEWIDPSAPESQVYYRLRQVDLDGQFELTPILSVPPIEVEANWAVYPTVATSGTGLTLTGESLDLVSAELYTTDGRTHAVIASPPFEAKLDQAVRSLTPGLYVLRLRGTDRVETIRLVR